MKISRPLALAALLVAALSCRDEPGRPFACSCTYLTDFDDASAAAVQVCAPTLERAVAVARGCAQSVAPAPVQECSCKPADSPPAHSACATGTCLPR